MRTLLHLRLRVASLAGRTSPRLAVFAVLALVAAWPWLATAGAHNEFRDAQYLNLFERDAVETVLRFAQFPRWDPYYCGGIYALGHPEARFSAPTFLFSLLLGSDRGQPVMAWLMLVVGMEGAYRLFRERCGSPLAPFLLAPVAGLDGFYGASYFHGWLQFLGFELVPWFLYGVSRLARGHVAGVAWTSVSFAGLVLLGSTYAIPIAALFGVMLFATTWPFVRTGERRPVHVLGLAALAAVFAAGISAVRLWPMLDSMIVSPRIMAGSPAMGVDWLLASVVEPVAPVGGNLDGRGWFYLSWLGLSLLAFAVLGGRRAVAPTLIAAAAFATATGYAAKPSLFALLRELPVFSTLRYPERFLMPATVFGLWAGALGVDTALRRAARRPLWWVVVLVAVGLVGGAVVAEVSNVELGANGRDLGPPPTEVARPFRQARGNRWIASHYPAMGRGSISCMAAFPIPMSERLRGDLAAEEYLARPSDGSVRRLAWSPNEIVVDVSLAHPSRLLVNQNWHSGWRASVGRVVSDRGLLGVDLPAGHHRVTLRFLPRSALGGALVSLVACLALWAFVRGWRRRPGARLQTAMLTGALPLLAFVMALAAIPDAGPRPMPMRNADGEPVVVRTLPSTARAVGAEFAVPVELVGAELEPAPDDPRFTRLSIYFRVHGAVPRDVGVFVHVDGPTGAVARSDHEVIGASTFFSNAPRGVLLRDVVYVRALGRPGPLRYYVGLWHASGDGSRVPVRSSAAPVDDDRVLAATDRSAR